MKKLSKNQYKIISAVLAVPVLAGASGIITYAQNTDTNEVKTIEVKNESLVENIQNIIPSKEETVYVLAGSDGAVKKVIVSDWLKNSSGFDSIGDFTTLKEIENVKGDESYSTNSNNMNVWSAGGKDIYYQGTTDKSLPVSMKISYKLDGKDISAKDLAGKSGKVTMTFDYTNNEKKVVTVNGKDEEVYVPFVMVTGMILDNDKFSNIQISNGKLMNDGDKSVVMGVALPGMQDNLGISSDKLDIPSSVEVTADVKDFELTTTMTVALNDVFNELNFDGVTDLDGLKNQMNELTDASQKLIDGSSTLYDGLSTLQSKSGELVSGVDKLQTGATALNKGANSLSEGTSALKDGTAKLNEGVTTLKEGTSNLSNGANELKVGMNDLNTGLNNLVANNATLNNGAESVFNTLLASANSQLKATGLQIPELTIKNYSTVLDSILSSLDTSSPVYIKLSELKSQLDSYNSFYLGLQQYTAGVEQASQGSNKLTMGANQLSAGADQLNSGANSLSVGVNDLSTGINQLWSGANELANGSGRLKDGVSTLKTGSGALVDGVNQLTDGSLQLRDGIKEFNDKGIQKIVDVFDGDITKVVDKLKAIVEASKGYNTFAGKLDKTDGTVKFIFKTDGIEQ